LFYQRIKVNVQEMVLTQDAKRHTLAPETQDRSIPMTDHPRNTDRDLLKPRRAFRPDDPEQTLTEAELGRVLKHFATSGKAEDPELRTSIQRQFQTLVDAAMRERFREIDGQFVEVQKPSTIVGKQMQQLLKVCEQLDAQLANLDQTTRTWLDQYLYEFETRDDFNKRVRLRDIEKRMERPINLLVHAAHAADSLPVRGPNNAALKLMIESLAGTWEICHGMSPVSDKARKQRDDPFLALCQEMAGFSQTRFKAKGGTLGTLALTGLVAEVLKNRATQPSKTPREK